MATKTARPTAKGVALGVLGHMAYQAATTPPASSTQPAANHALTKPAVDAMDTTTDSAMQRRFQEWKTEMLKSPPNVNDDGQEDDLEDAVADTR